MSEASAESDSSDAAEPGGEPEREPPLSLQLSDPKELLDAAALAWVGRVGREAIGWIAERGEARARLVDDEEMARVHGRWLDDPTTTDVLTFDLGGEGSGAPLDVDLYVCVDEARREAARGGRPVEHEVLLYILHGVLHCLGHDDRDPEAARAMHAKEDEILEAVGVGAVYASGVGGDGKGAG